MNEEALVGKAEPFGPFLERWEWPTGEIQYLFHCPGCQSTHAYWLAHADGRPGPTWLFDYAPERPTFSPSLRVRSQTETGEHICHLFVSDGQIQYCPDSTHALAGRTVPMEVFNALSAQS